MRYRVSVISRRPVGACSAMTSSGFCERISRMSDFVRDLEPVAPDGALRVVVDTPKGNRNKYKWDEDLGLFRLTKILPPGFAFPWNYGFLPRTRSEDGDPLDAIVFMEEPAFC